MGRIGWTSGIVSTWQAHQILWIPSIPVHNLQIRPGESTKTLEEKKDHSEVMECIILKTIVLNEMFNKWFKYCVRQSIVLNDYSLTRMLENSKPMF